MTLRRMTPKDYAKAIGVGIATAAILSLIMVPAFKAGLSPLPKPLGLAFAQVLLGEVALPVGLLFHVAYVTAWSAAYVVLFERRTGSRSHFGSWSLSSSFRSWGGASWVCP